MFARASAKSSLINAARRVAADGAAQAERLAARALTNGGDVVAVGAPTSRPARRGNHHHTHRTIGPCEASQPHGPWCRCTVPRTQP